MSTWVLLVVTLAGIAALTVALQRDMKRAEERRLWRERTAHLRAAYERFAFEVGTKLLPVMREMASAMQKAAPVFARFGAAMKEAGKR